MLPPPAVPWQLTGNHWVTLPCIHPADGSVHALGVLHRGARAAVEFAGGRDFVRGDAPPLLRFSLSVEGQPRELAAGGMAWQRAFDWVPTFTCAVESLAVRGTVFAPYGRDADVAGAIYAVTLENRGTEAVTAGLAFDGTLGHRQLRVSSPREFGDPHRVAAADADVVVLEGAGLPGIASVAVAGDHGARIILDPAAATFAMSRDYRLEPGERVDAAVYLAVGPERDGAEATVAVMRRRGWRELLASTRDALRALEQTTGNDALDRIINRNLLFAYFYGVGRALDDAHFYLVRSRAPWHGRGMTVRDWEALAWTVPAVQLADSPLARELILRVCEVHGYAPGRGVHYLDGTLFEPGFTLEGAAVYALAVDRYIRETGDDQVVDEPAIADTLYLSSEDIADRRDSRVPLYSTEVALSGSPVPYPFTLHANAVAAQALDVFRRTLDEETARSVEDPEAVRAAVKRHFAIDRGGKAVFASAIDLAGGVSNDDDPLASVLWLPMYDTVDRQDSVYRRSVRAVAPRPDALVQQCARLLGPDAPDVLEWLRRAPLDNGVAAEVVDGDGRATGNGGDAALSGLLAHSMWYAVHALGVRP